MTYGTKTANNTFSSQWQWLSGPKTTVSAKWLGFWTDDQPYIPEDAPDHPGYINWWKWTDAYGSYGINGAFPYVEGFQSSRNTLQADLSHYTEEFLGEHDIKFGAQYTKGRSNSQGGYFQNYVNFLYPYRWTQSVQYLQSWYGDTGPSVLQPAGHHQPLAHRAHRRLLRNVLRRSVDAEPARDDQSSGSASIT